MSFNCCIRDGVHFRLLRPRFKLAMLSLTVLTLIGTSSFEADAQVAFGFGSTQFDEGRAIAIDDAGNTYLFGKFRQTIDFDPGPGVFELTSVSGSANYVASYDANGELRYAFGINTGSTAPDGGIAVDGAGNVFVTGFFSGNADFDPGNGSEVLSGANGRIYVASYDSNGGFRFAFNIGVNDPTTREAGTAIRVDAAGNSYVTGEFTGETDFDPGAEEFLIDSNGVTDIFVASYTTNGSLRFAIGMGGTQRDRGLGIAIDGAGNSYVTGAFGDSTDFDPGVETQILVSNGDQDVFLASYTDSGHFRYALNAGSAFPDIGNAIAIDSAGNAFITGSFRDTADFDPGPGTLVLTSAGNEDLFLASYTDTGALRFAFAVGNSNSVAGFGAAVDTTGQVHVTGTCRGGVDFDPGPGQRILTNSSSYVFVASYSNTGSSRDAYPFKGNPSSSAVGYAIALDAAGRANVTGTFTGTVDFDPEPGEALLASIGSNDIFFSSHATAPAVPALDSVGITVVGALLGLLGWRRLRRGSEGPLSFR